MDVIIIGLGGHSKVARDIFKCMGCDVRGYYDDNNENSLGKISDLKYDTKYKYFCAIGNNIIRKNICEMVNIPFDAWINAIHPSAIISNDSQLGRGILISAGAIIQPNTVIGNHCIINTNTSIDHDCIIGDYSHIAPGTTLCGNVKIGNNTFICAGCTIINNTIVGDHVLIGAGSLVITNMPDYSKAFGSPARIKVHYN